MKTSLLKTTVVFSVMLMSQLNSRANDIVDFLRAVNGVPDRRPAVVQPVSRHGHPGHGGSGGYGGSFHAGGRPMNGGYQAHVTGRPNSFDPRRGQGFHPDDRVSFREPVYSTRTYPSRSRAQVTFNIGNGGYNGPAYIPVQDAQPLPPVDSYPVVPSVPGPGYNYPMQYDVGQMVDCQVPLATCVRVEDECNIAPNAVPVVVAVRDPNACAHNPNAVVFVEVCVPPCPPRSVRVSPCQTRVTMCYGQYEVDIKTREGFVLVDYDN